MQLVKLVLGLCMILLFYSCRTVTISGFVIDRSDSSVDLVLEIRNHSGNEILVPDELIITPDSTVNIHGVFWLERIQSGKRITVSPLEVDFDIDYIYLEEILDKKHMRNIGHKESYGYNLNLLDYYHVVEEGQYVLSLCINDTFFTHLSSPECIEVEFMRGSQNVANDSADEL